MISTLRTLAQQALDGLSYLLEPARQDETWRAADQLAEREAEQEVAEPCPPIRLADIADRIDTLTAMVEDIRNLAHNQHEFVRAFTAPAGAVDGPRGPLPQQNRAGQPKPLF